MEKTVTLVPDHPSLEANMRKTAADATALPEAPMPMPTQSLSPAEPPSFSFRQWLSRAFGPRLTVRS